MTEQTQEQNLSVNQRSVEAADVALKAHSGFLTLEEGLGLDVDVWHLLVSLQELCAAKGVDFNHQLMTAREVMKNGEVSTPAFRAAHTKWSPLREKL